MDGEWSDPEPMPEPITDEEKFSYFPSLTRGNTLYFTRSTPGKQDAGIWRSEFRDDAYQEPEELPIKLSDEEAHFNGCISPEEEYLVVCAQGRPEQIEADGTDYYVFFRETDGSWSEGYKLGPAVNMPRTRAVSPSFSPDGRYFFFATDWIRDDFRSPDQPLTAQRLEEIYNSPQNGYSDIYWVSSDVIRALKTN